MDKFKLKPGPEPQYSICESTFVQLTQMKLPYCKKCEGRSSLYAVCPECDNPIQIIGLYKNTPESGQKPYGRHFPHSIPNLAAYNEDAYLDCNYSNPQWKNPKQRRRPRSPLSEGIYQLLHDQFDRVLYVLEVDTGLRFDRGLARTMLNHYINDHGWTYRKASMNNLPWIFSEASPAIYLYGHCVKIETPLCRALQQCHAVRLELDEERRYARIMSTPNLYNDVTFVFYDYKQTHSGEVMTESIKFRVASGSVPNLQLLYEQEIQIDTQHFINLIHLAPSKAHRRQDYLDIADELLK